MTGSEPAGRDAPAAPTPAGARWARFRLAGVLVLLVLAVLVAVVTVVATGPPTKHDLLARAGLLGKRELVIGVKDDQPGISLRDPATGRFAGFDIDIAYLVAADLGFRPSEVRFLPIESEDRARMQARDGDRFVTVDLVIASYSITEERIRSGVHFSAPYLETEQSVVTRPDHSPVQALEELRGRRVCTLTTSTSKTAAELSGVDLAQRNRISECVEGLRRGEFEAVTTDAAILAGFVARYPDQLRQHDIGLTTPERYGINCGDNEALRTLVNLSLYHSLHDPGDRRWEDAFDRDLRSEQPVNLPQQVAIDRQPLVPKVRVREWPWEQSALPVPVATTSGS